ncbi:MAG: prepilin-type N-terminal cleavage/methylation domain-containing protein [Proteobacteria bacterium]|nr:prepilin-type N-terminal cleavage/methylation domain-containing protein [Pseudomonadota bacterium]MBU1708998.1 prepilin-type N-terminal cleavage/methylation domain-containing protein [Pseudomonadota bacterium]
MTMEQERMPGKRNHRKCQQGGFTLIEVLVAVTIMGLAYVVILQNFSMSMSNIVRVERKRAQIISDLIAFERQLQPEDPGEAGLLLDTASGEPFLEGRKYRLILVASENGDFETLLLEKN